MATSPKKGKPEKPFTQKQAAFIKAYTTPGKTYRNATLSAEEAGYANPEVNGSQILRNHRVREEIERILNAAKREAVVTAAGVLREIEETRQKALAKEQYSTALKASELKGKTLAMFTDRVEQVMTIEDVSSGDLLQLIREVAQHLTEEEGLVRQALELLSGGGESAEGDSALH